MKNICHNFYRKIIFNASALFSEQSCALEWNGWDVPSKIRQYQVENK